MIETADIERIAAEVSDRVRSEADQAVTRVRAAGRLAEPNDRVARRRWYLSMVPGALALAVAVVAFARTL